MSPLTEPQKMSKQKLKLYNTPQTRFKEAINIIEIITKQNYFTHNNKYYTQADGLPMESLDDHHGRETNSRLEALASMECCAQNYYYYY